jgi:glycosyltransferase involved in cell wall biosynthesis
MLARADLVLATSPVLAERLRARRPDAECWPNVADVALFRRALDEALPEPPELAGRPHPRAVYVGNLAAYRIDFALLEAAARAVAPGPLVLVGAEGLGDTGPPSEAAAALRRRPEVLRLGPRPPEALPAFLRHADVALVPFLDNEHTRGSLPLKLWEYLAAGLPVVARALPNLEALAAEGLARTASVAAGFGAAVREALAEAPEARSARARRALAHGWEERMEALVARVGRALAERKAGEFPQ